MAGRALQKAKKRKKHEFSGVSAEEHSWAVREQMAVELYARGLRRPQVARILLDELAPPEVPRAHQARLKLARTTLANWERRQWFRDRLWDLTVAKTDLATGEIMTGVVKAAKRGRVDAAKLALGIAGRYSEKQEPGQANVTVVIGGLARPGRELPPPTADIELEAEEVEEQP